jgi:hypothetical protein
VLPHSHWPCCRPPPRQPETWLATYALHSLPLPLPATGAAHVLARMLHCYGYRSGGCCSTKLPQAVLPLVLPAAGGMFVLVDIFLKEGEDRVQYMKRYRTNIDEAVTRGERVMPPCGKGDRRLPLPTCGANQSCCCCCCCCRHN